ncbi:MAG: hypothetical protein R2865_17570 [Deinococcales bacterium]
MMVSPTTWAELENMSIQIQQGEREAGNADFWGFVWQGSSEVSPVMPLSG